MPGEYDTGNKGHGQPLMRIDSHGITPLDAAQQVAVSIAEGRRRAVSAVQMKPQSFAFAQVGNGGNVVNDAGVGGAGGCDHGKRYFPRLTIGSDGGFECRNIQRAYAVQRDPSQCLASQSQ